jgi:hypothetical protein
MFAMAFQELSDPKTGYALAELQNCQGGSSPANAFGLGYIPPLKIGPDTLVIAFDQRSE